MHAIVTGATGVIGIALVKKLLTEQISVTAVCRPGSENIRNLPESNSLEICMCDLHRLQELPNLIDTPVDWFFHLGWLGTDSRDNRFAAALQVENIRVALDAVMAAKVLDSKVFVGVGSQAEYGRVADGILRPETPEHPVSAYGMAKLCAGQMTRLQCREAGVRHVWARPLSVYGPGDGKQTLISSAIAALRKGGRFSMTAGEQLWDYLYAADAAEALYCMAKDGVDGAIYPFGCGHAMPLKDYVQIIREEVNPSAELGLGDVPYLKDQVMHMEADNTALTRDTGWKPRTSFRDGIRSMLSSDV